MATTSAYLKDAWNDHILGTSALASPAAVYVALFVGGVEVTGGSYARVAAAFDASSGGVTQNTSLITFPAATANWGTITHVGIYDAVSSGNQLHYVAVTNKDVDSGDTAKFAAGSIVLTTT
jgi:hypothetical protein